MTMFDVKGWYLMKKDFVGKDLDSVIDIINNDINYNGTTKYYWLAVPVSFDNVLHYIRFPYGNGLTIEYENNIVTKVY